MAAALFALLLAGCGSAGPQPAPPDNGGQPSRADVPVVLSHPSGVLLTVPAGWAKDDQGGTLSLLSGDEMVLLTFIVVDVDDLEMALKHLGAAVDKVVKNSEMTSSRRSVVNGMRAVIARGSGELDDGPVDLGIALFLTPLGRVLIVIAVSDPAAPRTTREQLKALMLGIRPHVGRPSPPSQQP